MSLTEAEIREAFAEPASPNPIDVPQPPPEGLPRAFDLAVSLGLLVLAAPILIIVAILIRLESPGSPIYRQRRIGRSGEPFDLIKLRTMSAGSDPVGVGTVVGEADPRVTRIGAILRRLSLDELPNLVNVVRGEMAIIGPRPTIPPHLDYMSERQRKRHLVRPGITGWAQVNGRVGIEWGERIELDLDYIARRSRGLDLEILRRTIRGVASGEGVSSRSE